MTEKDTAAAGDASTEPHAADSSALWLRRPSRQQLHAAWRTVRWLLLRAGALLGMFLVFLLILTGAAGWYTSRPVFCRSCHIMEPYYTSWEESSHAHVSCIECHFAPGFGGKVRGKMLGLVQLAKYVTASEGPRPAAEIPDESCTRSGCHETRLLSGSVMFHGIPFDHAPHLKKMPREKKLRCTSCHSQIVQGKHMTVTTSTCFLCHFKEGLFNEGLGACTRCHQIPDKEIPLGDGVTFTHKLAYKRHVDCANCHGDLIRGTGEVSRERCVLCHNREDDLKQIDKHVFMHRKHVTEHKIDCLACHSPIEHSLDRQKIARAASNCASCHPNHHSEQLAMLQGVGAKTIRPQPSPMVITRADCRTCHRETKISDTGAVLLKGSVAACTICHDASQVDELQSYHKVLRAALPDLEAAMLRLRKALESAGLAADRAKAITAELDSLQHDLSFLHAGNDIHNIHYASKLTRALLERASALCRELKVAEPAVMLPPSKLD